MYENIFISVLFLYVNTILPKGFKNASNFMIRNRPLNFWSYFFMVNANKQRQTATNGDDRLQMKADRPGDEWGGRPSVILERFSSIGA
jgi:hypothetical protein